MLGLLLVLVIVHGHFTMLHHELDGLFLKEWGLIKYYILEATHNIRYLFAQW
jgi:hypothetical protein